MKLLTVSVVDSPRYPQLLSLQNCFVRGSVVRYIQLPSGEVNVELLQDAARKDGAGQKAK
jgi:U6 snRNA-associated Sm-like protein LSm2